MFSSTRLFRIGLFTSLLMIAFLISLLFVGCTTDEHQSENETMWKLSFLGSFLNDRSVDATRLCEINDYSDLLELIKPKNYPEATRSIEGLFKRDGWGDAFSFKREIRENYTVIVISSNHRDHKFDRPISLTIIVDKSGIRETKESWLE